jgi:hypothetical protein
MILTYFIIYVLVVLQLDSSNYFVIKSMISTYFFIDLVLSQRSFPNPAVTDPAPCSCDLRAGACDPNCCCDPVRHLTI